MTRFSSRASPRLRCCSSPAAMDTATVPTSTQPRKISCEGPSCSRRLWRYCLGDVLRTWLWLRYVRNSGLSFRPVLHEVSCHLVSDDLGRLQSWHISRVIAGNYLLQLSAAVTPGASRS